MRSEKEKNGEMIKRKTTKSERTKARKAKSYRREFVAGSVTTVIVV